MSVIKKEGRKMYITKLYVTKQSYKRLIENTIDRIMKEKKVSYDTACVVLYYSNLFRQFDFVFVDREED